MPPLPQSKPFQQASFRSGNNSQSSKNYNHNNNSNQIIVPNGYEQDEYQQDNDQAMKEKFFESLGLPPDLSNNSLQKFATKDNHLQNQQQQQQYFSQQNYNNEDDIESHLFKSCIDNDGLSPMTNKLGQLKKVNTGQTQNSYRTANGGTIFSNQTNINNNNNLNMNMNSNMHSKSHLSHINSNINNPHYNQQNQFVNDNISNNLDDLKSLDVMFYQDSQRKASAPTAHRQNYNNNISNNGGAMNYNQIVEDDESSIVMAMGGGGIKSNRVAMNMEDTLQMQAFKNGSIGKDTFPLNNNNNNFSPQELNQMQLQSDNQDMLLGSGVISNNNNNNNKELMTVTIEIGNGQSQNIVIHENDNPYQLAQEFAEMYQINDQIKGLLAEQIRLNIEQVLKEKDSLNITAIQQNNQNLQSDTTYDQMFNTNNNNQDIMNEISNQQQYQLYLQNQQQINENQNQIYNTNNNFDGHNNKQNINTSFNSMKNNIYQNPLYQQMANIKQKSSNNLSHFDESKANITNNNLSFLTDRSGYSQYQQQSNMMSKQNLNQQNFYNQWKDDLFQQEQQKKNMPIINENSKRIIESKRGISSNGTQNVNKTVHQRLHQQAVSKQKAFFRDQNERVSQLNQSNSNLNRSLRENKIQKNSNPSSPSKIDNSTDPIGQLQMMNRMGQQRASSQQNQRNLNNSGQQQNVNGNNLSTISGSQISQRPPQQILNYGERLYQKGLKRKEEFQRHIREAKNEQEQLDKEEFSFQPKINDVSKTMIRPGGEKAEDYLFNFAKITKEKIEQKRTEQIYEEIKECNFHPKITKKSERILSERNGGDQQQQQQQPPLSKFNNLYQDARRRQERQDKIYSACMESECTFQPDTQQTKYYFSKLEARDPNHIYERLSQIQSNNDKSLIKGARSNSKSTYGGNNELFDANTGQPFFHPKVGRGPKIQKRPDPKEFPIGEILYDQDKFIKEKLEIRKKAQEEERQQKLNTVFTKDTTNRIIERKKLSSFQQIFKVLDSDSDGQISAQRIDISQLSPDLLEILTPLFCEMEEMGQTLNEEEFFDACGRLYDSVSLPEKNVILQKLNDNDKNKKGKNQKEFDFKPAINANSQRIAAKMRPQGNIADLLISKQFEYDSKIKEKQQEKENLELVGCTFHPKILQSPQSDEYCNSSRSRIYNNRQLLMLNNSQQSLGNTENGCLNSNINIGNGINQNNQGYIGKQYKQQNNNNTFDLNNLAQNIASELLKQQAYNASTNIINSNNKNMMLALNNEGMYIPPGQINQQYQQQQQFQKFNLNQFSNSSSSGTANISAQTGIKQQLMMMH